MMRAIAVPVLGLGLMLPTFQSASQSGQSSGQPSARFLRDWVCRLDVASEAEWRSILASLPGGVTFGREEVTRSSELVHHHLKFETPFLQGKATWFSGLPAGGDFEISSDKGPFFETDDKARAFLRSIGSAQVTRFDPEVIHSAFSTYQPSSEDGFMSGSYGKRESPFSHTIRLEIDHLVAVDMHRNTIDAKFSRRLRMCR